MENSNSDPSHTRVRVEDQQNVFEKAFTLMMAILIAGESVFQLSIAIFTYLLSNKLEKRTVQLEIVSKKAEELAVQQQEIGVLREEVAKILQRLERQAAEEERERKELNCKPEMPDKIEDQERQPIGPTEPTFKETEASPPARLCSPAPLVQLPETGFHQQTETSHPNYKEA
jgi:hypothetical protein